MNIDDKMKIAEYQQKVLAGTYTKDDMKEALRILKEGRMTAAQKGRKTGVKAKPELKSGNDLMAALEASLMKGG